MSDKIPSFFGLAAGHPLNLIMLGAVGVSAALTGSWIPLAVGAGAELLWLTVGARTGGFAGYVEHRKREALAAGRSRGQQAKLSEVSEADRRRYLALDTLRGDIRRLVAKSDQLEQGMLEPELQKVDHLVDAFVDLAARVATYAAFVEDSDLDQLEAEVRRQEAVLEKTSDPEDKRLAADNLELMQARLQRAAEVRRLLKSARGQLNLIENTLELMRDQIATLQSPEGLSDKLDDLVRSVEAIEASAKETRALEARAQSLGVRS